MAYKDILPTTNLQAVDIRDTIGCPSNNLAHYCCMAKSGGKQYGNISLAFNTIEVGGAHNNGKLIAQAVPYFNIYSNKAPGEWCLYAQTITYRLKRYTYGDVIMVNGHSFDETSYCYDLGKFAGYTAQSAAPFVQAAWGKSGIGSTNEIGVTLPLGAYDWFTLACNSPLTPTLNNLYVGIREVGQLQMEIKYVLYSDYLNINSSAIFTIRGDRRPNSLVIAAAFYLRQGDIYNKLFDLPIESSSNGNGGFVFEKTISIKWAHVPDSTPEVGLVLGYTSSDTSSDIIDFYIMPYHTTQLGWTQNGIFYFSDIKITPDFHQVTMERRATATIGGEALLTFTMYENVVRNEWFVSGSIERNRLPATGGSSFKLTLNILNLTAIKLDY